MKKILGTLLILGLMLPVAAEEVAVKNEKQQKDEKILRAIINSDAGRLAKHHTSIKEDSYLYKNNDKNSVYYQILSLETKYKKKSDMQSKLNLSYVEKVKTLYLFLAEYPSDKAMSSEFLEEFNSKIIIIPDNEYDLIDEDVVMFISLINVYK